MKVIIDDNVIQLQRLQGKNKILAKKTMEKSIYSLFLDALLSTYYK